MHSRQGDGSTDKFFSNTHEGYEGAQRSVVVDGQWTQQRKHRVAKMLSPLCALCGSEGGSLIHTHFRCSEVQYVGPGEMLGLFHEAAEPGALWRHESRAAQALLPALRGRPPGYTVPYETRWTGDRSLFNGIIYGDCSAYEGHDTDLCGAGWGLVANTSAGQPVTVSGTLPFLIQDVDGAELFGRFMFLRIARAPAQCVTDSSFVEQGQPAWAFGHRAHISVGGFVARRLVRD